MNALSKLVSTKAFLTALLAFCLGEVASAAESVTLTISPFQTNVLAGVATTVTATVNVTIAGGTTAVTLAASGQPSGDTATLGTTSFTGTGSTTLTVVNAAGTAAGNYPITIAASGGATYTEVFGLIVGNSAWTAGGGVATNWSASANWSAAVTAGSAVVFTDIGRSTAAVNVSNAVDTTTWISSLQYAHGSNFQSTLIPSGVALNVTNAGGLMVGSVGTYGYSTTNTAAISGAGTLNVSNVAASLVVNQGDFNLNSSRAVLDLSALTNFNANVKAIGIGSLNHFTSQINQRSAGSLYLARTNLITLGMTNTLSTYLTTPGVTNAVEISYASANNNASVASYLYLGQTNVFYVDSLGIGRSKSTGGNSPGWMLFNPSFPNSVAYFRGVNGNASRVTWWGVGDMADQGSSAQNACGTNDFTGGTVDLLVDTMCLGRDTTASQTAGTPDLGALLFGAGTINVNTLYLGYQAFSVAANKAPAVGVLTMTGSGTFSVNTAINLGQTNGTASIAAGGTYGVIAITNGGTLQANTINVYTNNVTNLIVLKNSSTLFVTNTLATNYSGLATFTMTNSTLGLTMAGNSSLRGLVQTLNTGGSTNLIQLLSVPVYATYPTQIALVKFTTWNGTNNFGLTNLPGSAPGATIVSNHSNSSIDISLPTNPRPVITVQPSSAVSTNPGTSLTLTVTVSGVAPLSYQWYNGATVLTNGANVSGSTNYGVTTSSLTVSNLQSADSGNYTVVVTNAYGTATSTPASSVTVSSSDIAPTITGPGTQTATNGITTVISDTVAGSPPPVLQWRFNGVNLTDGPGPSGLSTVSGSTSSTLTIVNPQYSADQGTYSLVASNTVSGVPTLVTNATGLTVLVAPIISSQPASLVVTNGNPASFSVTSTNGVPGGTYQWYKNSSPISGQTASNLTISATAPSDTATYYVVVQNSAGSATSSSVTLTVNSSMGYISLTPANGASGVSYDTPLYLNFTAAPALRRAGTIKIYSATNITTPADTIDLSQCVTNNATYAANVQPYTVGGDTFTNFPVIITGTTAAIYPHHGMLVSNQTYYVTVDNGSFTDGAGAYFAGISNTNAWRFTTKAGGPAVATNLVVAQDYSGDFATVQGALDSVPANNTTPTVINIRNGTYTEIINVKAKNNVTFRGQSRAGTIIAYANNSFVFGNTHNRMTFKVNANDIALDCLTVTNSTPQDASQAEALMFESGAARGIVNNCDIDSYQDTLLANISTSKAYFNNSLIQGDVDFIWGGGNLFFTNCEVRYLTRAANGAALGPNPSPNSSTDISSNGFSFINCRLTTLPGGNPADTIGRTRSITNANMALINCMISTNISGWYSDAAPTSLYRNWYYGCTNDLGVSVTLSNGIALAASDPNLTLAGSATTWLYGWAPQLSPNITAQPAGVSLHSGPATFTVAATGIPDPGYQWYKNGSPIANATNASYTATVTRLTDGGATYAVAVTNAAGSVTSSVVTLTVTDTAPVANPAGYARAVGVMLRIRIADLLTNASDADSGDTLTLVGVGTDGYNLASVTGSTLTTNGAFIFYTNSTPVDVGDSFQYVVSDSLGALATNTVSINVPINYTGQAETISISGSTATLTFAGIPGDAYEIERSTNMLAWVVIDSYIAPAGGLISFTDSFADLGGVPAQAYYRLHYTVPAAAAISAQPAGLTATEGQSTNFTVDVSGTSPFSYQWFFNLNTPVSGATNATLTVTNIQPDAAGGYSVVVSNAFGVVTSSVAQLVVTAAPGMPALPAIPAGVRLVTASGAVGDGVTTNTTAIQSAINAANAAGGGTVEIPAGVFLCGPLSFSNYVNLQIDAGAVLQMLPFGQYPGGIVNPATFITGSGLHDIEISGPGTIDGQGSPWWPYAYTNGASRPTMLSFSACSRVLLLDTIFSNSPAQHIGIKGNNAGNVTILGITVKAPASTATVNPSHNTDGIDLAETNALIQACLLDTGDDNIAIGSSAGLARDILVTNCFFGAGHGCSIGSYTSSGVSNLTVIDCTFSNTDNGIRIKTDNDRGGTVQNLNYFNLSMTNVGMPFCIYDYYNAVGTPRSVSPNQAATQTVAAVTGTTPIYRNLTFSNITAYSVSGNPVGIVWARTEMPATNLVFNRVNLTGDRNFCLYNVSGAQFIDCNLNVSSTSNTFALFNAQVIVTNSAPTNTLCTFDGLTTNGYGSTLALYNAQGALVNTNILDNGPLTLGGASTLTVSNNLTLFSTTVLSYVLAADTVPTELAVAGDLALGGTVNVSTNAGFAPGTYTLMTYTGTPRGNLPALGTTPSGFACSLDTNTAGQVNLIVSP